MHRFERLQIGVDDPCERNEFARVDGHFLVAIESRSARRQCLTNPIGRNVCPRTGRCRRHAFTTPPRDIRNENVIAKMQLRLEDDPPTAWTTASSVKCGI